MLFHVRDLRTPPGGHSEDPQIRTIPYPNVPHDVMARAIEGKRSDDHLFTTVTGCALHSDIYRLVSTPSR